MLVIYGLDLLARFLKYSENSAICSSGVFTLAPSFAFFGEVAMAVIFGRLVSRSRQFIDVHFTVRGFNLSCKVCAASVLFTASICFASLYACLYST